MPKAPIIKQFMWRIRAALISGPTLRLLSDPTGLLVVNLLCFRQKLTYIGESLSLPI